MDRLTSGTNAAASIGWTLDADGNRKTQSGTVNPVYPAANLTLAYNNRGRLASATASGTTNYVYNALGQRIEKSGPAGVTLFSYDEAGHLLGEYTSTGALVQETIWLGDLPVATLMPNGATVAIYYIHADHLGAPRAITRPSDNAIVWRWDTDPFGVATPNQNPGGLGTFVYNLRFPGQYYDAETGLNQNYFRDYDAAVGRYMQSDRMGLAGGVNTYAYVRGNPISWRDPLGLWSITAAIYVGPGVEITIGSDDGRGFVTGRVGIGIGAGVGFDPYGRIPGPAVSDSCRGGIVLGASVKGDLRSGPFDFGAELGGARNYTLSQAEFLSDFNAQLQFPWQGVEAAISVGGQFTVYQGKH